ncbi:twin-arginine translocase subunit TatC [Pseudodesulfovibrio cashew]|uniref:Sec-independent protein translocase protein TatC n=1 Tax=Pseudodesulfovibrio cashew TaxID=2678688 RepID=A0A6I6JKK1_9BACT|nr:twin-arginine translocase subunit TatC [Pseudodesulfovibrio cashew]QGY41709.1 twin-arginine translocase subunit TatC [Pseudodesulfovibrio cashew]
MASDKDDVKELETGETAAVPDDDPSLEEEETPAPFDMEGKAAEKSWQEDLADAEAATEADAAAQSETVPPVYPQPEEAGDGGSGEPPTGDSEPVDEPADPDEPEGGEPEDGSDDEPDGEDDGEGAQMSLLDHLGELRVRLTKCFIAVAVGMVACYGFADRMFDILMAPMIQVFQSRMASKPQLPLGFFDDLRQALTQVLAEKGFQHSQQIDLFVNALQQSLMQVAQEGHFQYTYPAEAFFSHIKIAIVAGLFLVSPYVFAQIWGFIAPGLYAHERKWMIPMALVSAIFFTAGALFGYFIVFPYGFEFFASFSTEGIQFTPKLNEYLSFCLKLLFAFGFVFELPLFIFFLARLGMVSSTGLRKKRKYAILIGFVVAAILTPPDPFTQCLMAGPLILLYELGIWVAFFFGKKEKRHLKKQAEEEAAKQAALDAASEQDAAGEEDAGEPDGDEAETEKA